MEKTLLKSKEEFDSFIDDNTGLNVPSHGTVRRWCWAEEPKKYPCIAVWEIQYNGDGPDMLEYELVYLDDFVDLADFANLDNFDEEDGTRRETTITT